MKNKHGLIICTAVFIFGVYFMPTIVAIAAVGALMFAVLAHDDVTHEKKITMMLTLLRSQIINQTPPDKLSIEQQQELDALEDMTDDEIEARYHSLSQTTC
jgi:hypothetical protein